MRVYWTSITLSLSGIFSVCGMVFRGSRSGETAWSYVHNPGENNLLKHNERLGLLNW